MLLNVPTPRKLPSGKYNVQVQINKKRKSITADTAKECRQKALLYLAAAQNNLATTDIKRSETLAKAMTLYVDSRSNVISPSTLAGYRKIIRGRFRAYSDTPIGKIRNWQAVVNEESKLCSAKTLKNAWSLASSTLRFCGLPVPNVTLPQIVRTEHPFLQPDEIRSFIDACRGDSCELPMLLALHGLRRSEVLAVERKDALNGVIVVSGSVVMGEDGFVRKDTNKNTSSARKVPVVIPRVNTLVAESKDGPLCRISANSLLRHVDATCDRAGLPRTGLHGLRHSFASLCYHLGLSEMETMKLGGWSSPAVMRNIYTHLEEVDRTNAAAKLKGFFGKCE